MKKVKGIRKSTIISVVRHFSRENPFFVPMWGAVETGRVKDGPVQRQGM